MNYQSPAGTALQTALRARHVERIRQCLADHPDSCLERLGKGGTTLWDEAFHDHVLARAHKGFASPSLMDEASPAAQVWALFQERMPVPPTQSKLLGDWLDWALGYHDSFALVHWLWEQGVRPTPETEDHPGRPLHHLSSWLLRPQVQASDLLAAVEWAQQRLLEQPAWGKKSYDVFPWRIDDGRESEQFVHGSALGVLVGALRLNQAVLLDWARDDVNHRTSHPEAAPWEARWDAWVAYAALLLEQGCRWDDRIRCSAWGAMGRRANAFEGVVEDLMQPLPSAQEEQLLRTEMGMCSEAWVHLMHQFKGEAQARWEARRLTHDLDTLAPGAASIRRTRL